MNAPWILQFSNRAKKSIQKIPAPYRKRIERIILALATNPWAGKPLKGEMKGLHSLRIWPYRVLYIINESKTVIEIVDVGHRQGIYR